MERRRTALNERAPEKRLTDLLAQLPAREEWDRLNTVARGEKPFSPDFYNRSRVLEGLRTSDEIVILLPDDIGDAVLTAPIVLALQEWMKLSGEQKDIRIVSTHPELFRGLVPVIEPSHQQPQRYAINAHATFSDVQKLGVRKTDEINPMRCLSVNETSWVATEERLFALPQRVMRNIELLLGQKLFDDAGAVEKWMGIGQDFKEQRDHLRGKYRIRAGEQLLTISAGASVMPKEYAPEKWQAVLGSVLSQHPELHVLFLEDPSTEKRDRYAPMLKAFIAQHREWNISRVSEGLEYMNTIMEMTTLFAGPDTGLGHLAGAHGVPNVLLYLSNPKFWRTPKTVPVTHRVAERMARKGILRYEPAWDKEATEGYFVRDRNQLVGVSGIEPGKVITAIVKNLS